VAIPAASILITGASSGLGAALAEAYAKPGVSLHLTGRNAGRLDATASLCRARGADVATRALDVT
jgi:NADP-dependent 3-hydroxy acid dehydrogenase YdfG